MMYMSEGEPYGTRLWYKERCEQLEAELARLRPLAEAAELLPADIARLLIDYMNNECSNLYPTGLHCLVDYAEAMEKCDDSLP